MPGFYWLPKVQNQLSNLLKRLVIEGTSTLLLAEVRTNELFKLVSKESKCSISLEFCVAVNILKIIVYIFFSLQTYLWCSITMYLSRKNCCKIFMLIVKTILKYALIIDRIYFIKWNNYFLSFQLTIKFSKTIKKFGDVQF